jgi:hypothetical protein
MDQQLAFGKAFSMTFKATRTPTGKPSSFMTNAGA